MSHSSNGTSIPAQALLSILQGMDAPVLVTDLQTDEILFTNAAMNAAFGIMDDPSGRPGREIYGDEIGGWCDTYAQKLLTKHQGKPYMWETFIPVTGKWLRNYGTLIDWTDGRRACMLRGEDVTREHSAKPAVWPGMASELANLSSDSGTSVQALLAVAGGLLEADCAVLLRFEGAQSVDTVGRWQRDVENDAANWTPTHAFVGRMRHAFQAGNCPFLTMMDAQAFCAALMVPVFRQGVVWGALCFTSEERRRPWHEGATALAGAISATLGSVLSREEKMQAQESRLAELAGANEKLQALADQAARAKRTFLSRMSHEMRTPMNAIIGMTNIAQKSRDIERVRYCMGKVEDAASHLLNIIDDVLDISWIEAGEFELYPHDFVLENTVRRVINANKYRFDQKEQAFDVTVDQDVPYAIVADQKRLEQVLVNLLSNAAKFTPRGGNIRFAVRRMAYRDGRYALRFEVEDNGIGMSQEQQFKLFRSFEQGDDGMTRRFGGNGLGLAISRTIVEKMGGHIQLHSEPGRGSLFVVEVWVQEGQGSRMNRLRKDVDWANKHFLVVDDARDIREYFEDVLDSMGIDCDTAANGFEACEKLEDGSYDIVFVDWMMPGMDGLELTRRIRARYGRDITVIMISGASWESIREQSDTDDVDRFVPKPLMPSLIVDCVNECLAADAREALPPAGYTLESFAGKRVLLAEDNELNREILIGMLADTGIVVECAENGRAACERFAQDPNGYDLIFMDVHMPEMDGYTATRTIRAMPVERAREIPIVATTANVFHEDIDRCLEAGMNDHIGKPLDAEEVMKKLAQYLKIAQPDRRRTI